MHNRKGLIKTVTNKKSRFIHGVCVLRCGSVCHGLQGKRFLQLKNPWSHLRWKGRYSERDEKNWTPDLLKYLKFDPKTAQKFDNGKGGKEPSSS